MLKKVLKNIYSFGMDMSRHNSAAYASSVAFFFFMSLIPSLMFVFSLFKYLPLTEGDLIEVMADFVPVSLLPAVRSLVGSIYTSSVSVLPITIIASLWTANMGMLGLIRGLNGVLELTDKRNYLVLRLVATIYTLLMLVGLIASLVLMGFGRKIVALLDSDISKEAIVIANLMGFRHLIGFVVLTLLFALAYTFLPAENQNFILTLPGAVFASIGWNVVTGFFSIYVDLFNGFSIYGSLTLVMVLLFWLYTCFSLLIIGAFLNKYYKKYFEHRLVRFRVRREAKREEKGSVKESKKTK